MFNWSRLFRIVISFSLGILLAGIVSACQQQPSGSSFNESCYRVEHAAGETCVPNQVERLVTLDTVSFENAVALGLQPIATVDTQQLGSYLQDSLVDVVDIGQPGAPNLEKISTLRPDFILGLDLSQPIYGQLSQIAPTVLVPFEHSGLWKEDFQNYSRILNREEIGQQVMDDYQRRAQDFRQRFESQFRHNERATFEASIIRIYPDTLNFYFRESFPGVVLDDAGLARPESQDISASEAKRLYRNPIQASISLEQLPQADADALFVWTSESEATDSQTAQERWKTLQENPLWQQLDVVQKEQVYFVPNYWIGTGPLAANAMIDDLFKYLLEPVDS